MSTCSGHAQDAGCFIGVIVLVAAWLTHIAICLQAERWGFLIAGAIAYPVGVVHGIGHWLELW